MIKLKNLNKFFFKGKKNEIHVLNDISLDLGEKGLVAIHGASGSGKTTLLNVIGGLDKVQSGEIDFYDEYITGYKSSVWDKIRNEYVGYVFQNYYLLPELSVFENIKFVLRNLGIKDENEIEQRVNYVLKALGMYQFRKKKALQLSGGQQQRVAIARALVKSPKVVIADEPTGNLDSKNTVEIMNIIKEISKETLVILVTHDKEIANVYADRIIYMVDGKITNDIINEYNSEHNIVDDAIYLKDLKNYQSVKNEQLDIKYYSDEKFENVEIKLILKNDTLYVDVEGFDNVKLANKSSGVIIKEEHYKKKTKEEAIKTTYEVKKLDHLDVKKEKGMLFSFKQAFKQACKKLLRIGRKGKLMLISFAIAGAIIAYAVATFAAVTINRPEKYMKLPKGYVSFESNDYIAFDLNELETLKANDEKFYINPFNDFKGINLDFLNTDGTVGLSYNPYYSVAYDRLEHAKNYKLAIGKYSEDVNEIVITTAFAKTFLNDSRSQDFGIWTKVNILQEKIRFSNVDAKIVGIVESDLSLIFVSDSFILYQSGSFKPLEAYKNINFIYGIKPKENHEISVNQAVIEFITSKEAKNVVFPVVIDGFLITGVHDVDVEYLYLQETIKNNLNEYYSISIYSSNPTKLIKDLKEKYDILAVDVYKDGVKMFKNEQAARLIGVSITTAILVGATLVGFYFVIRSSLIERIYEVAVYRALGVKKKEVVFSFGVEIISITTITTLMGYLFMSYILKNVQNSVLGDFMQLYINSLSLLAGVIVIYLLNLLVGLLPIFMLLRKTPSQILSQYDI